MSHLVARLLLCVLMFPVAVVVYCVTFIFWERLGYQRYGNGLEFFVAGLVAWGFVVIYWTALWRKSIPWTPRRRRAPKVAGGIGIVIGAIGYFSFDLFGIDEVNLVLLGILIPSLWLIATIIYWRETLAERAARLGRTGRANISCPTCGYNLTGLSEARCPECGSKFTLDELVARQPGAAAGEIE